jgi:hypothetical protein
MNTSDTSDTSDTSNTSNTSDTAVQNQTVCSFMVQLPP